MTGMKSEFELEQTEGLVFCKRDGRKKCLLLVFLTLCLAVAVAVGLALGLRKSHDNSNADSQCGANNGATTSTSTTQLPPAGERPPSVLLVLVDGFRPSYLSDDVTPNIQRLMRQGVHSPRMLAVYPTLSLPNLYTIFTGLYPESHGIIDDHMFDVNFHEQFRESSFASIDPKWYSGEPIWETAERQGVDTVSFLANTNICGQNQEEYRKSWKELMYERVDAVLDKLSRPADSRPGFVSLYLNEPDFTGHSVGPSSSPRMIAALKMVDDTVGRLAQGIQRLGLDHDVNLIIVSDHGMAAKSCNWQVTLGDYFNLTELGNMYVFGTSAGRINNRLKYSRGNFTVLDQPVVSTESILQRLSGQPNIAVYKKSQLPERLHYANNIRIDDIVLKMDVEWVVSRFKQSGSTCSGGTHGWDSQYPSMSALFLARGPAFKEGVEIPPFENIELYNLIADMLNITAAPNNGTRGSLHHVLKNPPKLDRLQTGDYQCQHTTAALPASTGNYCSCSSAPQTNPSQISPANEFLQPAMSMNEPTLCLSDTEHKTVYSTQFHMPLWVAFTARSKEDVLQDMESCIVLHPDLPADERDLYMLYSNESVTVNTAAMFAAKTSCGSIALSSDVIPMMKNLKEDLWDALWRMVRLVTGPAFPPVSVTLGPVFDYNHDGLPDDIADVTRYLENMNTIPMPSHYFVILARCPEVGQVLADCTSDVDLLSFLLPNEQNKNGQSPERRLLENVARVRDIELLTGLAFFTQLEPSLSARLRTYVPTNLWTKPGSWKDANICSNPGDFSCSSSYQPLLLISLDGFRADYLVKYNRTPTIEQMIKCGVHAPYMRSAYPTKTFPNHYTIVTGLYPESHGIIDNNMYDFNISEKFCMSCDTAKDPQWWGGMPIWLTAKVHGLKTATYFWPGSDVPIQGEYPDDYKVYKNGVPFTQRVDTVLQWLRRPADERPQFLTLYFNEPDHTGHVVGPDSPQIGEKLAEVDSVIERLMEGLYQQDLHHCVNIIIVADHGMSSTSCDRIIPLSTDISGEDLGNIYVYDGPVGRISNKYKYGRSNNIPLDPPKVSISSIVKKLECSDPHMRVYTKPHLPIRHHFTNIDRIDDIILDADDRWLISRTGSTRFCDGGNHGYDNLYASMHALFLAYGPAFRNGVEIKSFENIELYNLMADVLGVTPAPNNGTEGTLFQALRNPPSRLSARPSVAQTCSNQSNGADVYKDQTDKCNCSTVATENVSSWISPLGNPVAISDGPSFCVAYQSDHITAYNTQMMAPTWISFNINVTNSSDMTSAAPCVVMDSWMPPAMPALNATLWEGTGYVPASLLLGFHTPCNAAMASEIVPMLADFKTGIWKEVEQLVTDYSIQYGEIGVTVGPVYNDDVTGVWKGRTNKTRIVGEVYPVPTHFFLVMGKCSVSDQSLPCWESLHTLSFLIPHVSVPSNCQNFSMLMRENVARIRDIEIATGLQFFSNLGLNVSQSAELRTFLPTQLWNGSAEVIDVPKPGHWVDQECPPIHQTDTQCSSDYQPVLVVSLDGFKPQYLGRGLTPVIDRLVSCGVHAPYMRSVYPTKTFPNHYSIVTGLYPESHGIIDNNMYDFTLGKERFSISSSTKNNPGWWGGEPIWLTAQRQNVSSASYFWVGSDILINGSYPDLFKYYTGSVPYSSRVRTIVEWMKLPASRRPNLLFLYFDEPDHQAHISGPFTRQVDQQVQRVDNVLGELMDLLYQQDLHHCVNLVVLSDHGFSYLSCDQVIEMKNYFTQTEKYDLLFFYGPFSRISNTYRRLRNGTVLPYSDTPPFSIHDVQVHLHCVDHLKVYAKTDLPVRHHYVNNDRIDNIILDPVINWTVSDKVNQRYCTGGSHGWDNSYKAMEALFVGYGPAFKNRKAVDPFENIELYNMISDILGIHPSPNNGTEGSLDHLLQQTFNRTRHFASNYSIAHDITTSTTVACNCLSNFNTTADTIIIDTMNSQNVSHAKQTALPFGAPLLMRSDMRDITMLYQPAFVTAFSTTQKVPVWVSTTVSAMMLKNDTSDDYCIVEDPRVASVQPCTSIQPLPENVSIVSLLPTEYSLGPMAFLLSSHVLMLDSFSSGVWQPLQTYLSKWSVGYQGLNIIAGSIFDGNSDGLADSLDDIAKENVTIPSHVFVIASRCSNSSQSLNKCSKLQVLSFILPQVDTSKEFNCQTFADYLKDNEARVRDVELITDLHFFPDLPFTQAVALRTYLPSGPWA